MATGGAEEHFAKKLAHNEKKIRDRAVNKLQAWIQSRPKDGPGFGEVDLLKIWKGLFYCMWMSDKPLIQEELALNLSQLVFSFRNEQSAVLFIKMFFKTMQREWHGIDRLRLDKFYMLIRFFVKETFNFLKKSNWEENQVAEVSTVFHEEPLNPNSLAVPDGVRLHLVAVYFTELESILDDQLPSNVLLKLLDPLFLLATHSNNVTVTNAVKKSLFEHLFQGDTKDPEHKQSILVTKVDFAAIADRLFSLASDRNILSRNRKQLFKWVKRLRNHAKGDCEEGQRSVQQGESLNGLPVGSRGEDATIESKDITTNCLAKEDDTSKPNEPSGRKTKRRKKKCEDQETEEGNYLCGDDKEATTRKKRKMSKKESLGNDGLCFGDEGAPDDVKVEPKKKKKQSKSLHDSNDNTANSKKQKLDRSDDKKSDMVNGTLEGENETLATDPVPQTSELSVNESGTADIKAAYGTALVSSEKQDFTSSKVEKKVVQKAVRHVDEPFAQFQNSSSPPAFVRRRVSKTPRSEPQRRKANGVKDQTPGSVPGKGMNKRVRIEVSKNTAHTTQDYQRSLKDSPKIPFDASRTPVQGLLKSPPKPQRTPFGFNKKALSSKTEKRKKKLSNSSKRPKAVDFF